MGLTNPQYEKILRDYDRKQAENRALQESRIREAYRKIPQLQETEEALADLSYQRVQCRLTGDAEKSRRLERQVADLREERKVLLASGIDKIVQIEERSLVNEV